MLFYSRMVVHDIHLLSEIKKEIKVSHDRNTLVSAMESSNIQLFGTKTATIISDDNS